MKFSFKGLSADEVVQSRQQHGDNRITTQAVETFWDKLKANFEDPIIIILLVALVVTIILAIFGYAHWYEGVGIAIAVALATLVATWSEYSNETEFQQLLEEASAINVKVFRDGHLGEINIGDLVVGDHILLQPGDTIPTDGYLVSGHIDCNQASLTGESEAVHKKAAEDEAKVDNDTHGVYRAALVEDGEAVMKAVAVGDKTQYGETMKEIISAEDRLSPLQEKLAILGKHISTFGYVGAVFIFFAFMANNIFLQTDGGLTAYLALPNGEIISDVVTAMILAIVVIVVAVPEGLPMMIAMVLALNMKKLLNVKVLVRKLLGIETAGSLTVLFSDKTGTLTQGKLSAETFVTGTGSAYANLGELSTTQANTLTTALRYNTSAVIDASDKTDIKLVGADRTEQALLRFLGDALAEENDNIEIVDMIQFSSSRKFSATQITGESNQTLVKGAPEIILANCTHYLDEKGARQEINHVILEEKMAELSAKAMRLLAIAVTDDVISEDNHLPQQLTLVGFFGLRDALRETSYSAVKSAKDAGIQVIMITGDAKATAEAIAKDVGLLEDEKAKIITSTELEKLSDEEVKTLLPNLYVVARAYPTDKSRLVKLAKEMNWVVGMTGDGVNDAPAVKNADVGFSMGSGTEMTKESSDIVILDDNFASITKAVLYGRTLFKSIRKFLIFQLTVNISAILVAFLGPFFGIELPLTMIQLLWINIIMDTLAGLAFAGEAALNRYMYEKPIPKEEPLINNDMWSSILINGVVAAIWSMIFLKYPPIRELFATEASFLTAFFAFFVFMHAFNTFNARTQSLNLFENIFDNRLFLPIIAIIFIVQTFFTYVGGEILRTVGLQGYEWGYVIAFAVILIPVDLIRKAVRNKLYGNPVLDHAVSA